MKFEEAMVFLRNGKSIKRSSNENIEIWFNGKLFIQGQLVSNHSLVSYDRKKDEIDNYDWRPAATDLFTEDWEVVE